MSWYSRKLFWYFRSVFSVGLALVGLAFGRIRFGKTYLWWGLLLVGFASVRHISISMSPDIAPRKWGSLGTCVVIVH